MEKRIVMDQIVYNTLYNCNLSKVSITVICLYFILSHFLFYINYFSIEFGLPTENVEIVLLFAL